jgi:DNA-binding CsgD family transcriptional regulator
MSHSTQPTLAQIRSVFRLLGEMRELANDRAAWRNRMVFGLCELLGARQGSVIGLEGFHPGGEMRLIDAVHGGWANPLAAAIWEGHLRSGEFKKDVLLIEAQQDPDIVAAKLRAELVPDEQFYAAPLVRELLPMMEIDSHVLGWQRMPGGGEALGLTFHRELGARAFSAKERVLLRLFIEELHLLRQDGKLGPTQVEVPPLSRREQQVLDRLLAGASVKETAGKLSLSVRTVEDYVKTIYRKHGVHSRGELMARYVR